MRDLDRWLLSELGIFRMNGSHKSPGTDSMRWPLRLQIMLPMAAIMLLTVLFVGGLGAYLAARGTRARIDSQVAAVTKTLAESNFPLTDAVLRHMKVLSGAEMVLVDSADTIVSTSGAARQFDAHLVGGRPHDDQSILVGDRIWVRDQQYFHTAVHLSGRRGAGQSGTLHIFYPEQEYRRAWQRSVYPSLAFVILALPVVMVLAALTASKISRRMMQLQHQVDRIAEGDFQQMVLADRDDEIRALGMAVNRMATMLSGYEEQVRQTERMRTLAQLGGGVAHQFRNAVTGCNMALELHAEECAIGQTSESLDVAKRQLRLMEEYVQRFLKLGKPAEKLLSENVDLSALLDDMLPLVQPAARHAGIDLQWDSAPESHSEIVGDAAALNQLVINLLLNAIEAASNAHATSNLPGRVVVALSEQTPGRITLSVSDSGRGPADKVRDKLFEPFVTEKSDGIGLGLSVASDVAARHGGQLSWRRVRGMTEFTVDFPIAQVEVQCA
jgi:signal transduction histidine kinase